MKFDKFTWALIGTVVVASVVPASGEPGRWLDVAANQDVGSSLDSPAGPSGSDAA